MQSLDLKVVPCWISISWLTLKQTRLFRSVLGVGEHQCFPNITVFPWVTHMSNQGLWRRCNLPRDQLWLVVVGAMMSTKRNTVGIHMEFRSSYFVFLGLKTVLAKWTVLPYYGSTHFYVESTTCTTCTIQFIWYPWWIVAKWNSLPFPGPGINDLLPVFAPRRGTFSVGFPAWWVFESQNSSMGWGVCAVNGVVQGFWSEVKFCLDAWYCCARIAKHCNYATDASSEDKRPFLEVESCTDMFCTLPH